MNRPAFKLPLMARAPRRTPPVSGPMWVAPIGPASAVPADEWNALERRGFHRHDWFRVAERGHWEPRHVAVYRPGGLLAVFPVYAVGANVYGDLHDRWLGRARFMAPRLGLRLRPTLSVGAPFSTTSEPLGDISPLPEAILDDVFEALEAQARAERAKAVVWPFLTDECGPIARVGARRGYLKVRAGSTAYLPVKWDSFDGYLASRRKSVRRTVRTELGAFATAGLRIESVIDFRALAERMSRFYHGCFVARNGVGPKLPADFFEQLAARPAPGFWAQLTWAGDQLVGMSLNLEAGGRIDGGFCAFLPEYQGGPAYHNDLVYEPVRQATRTGVRRIELGPSALYPKLLRGGVLQPQFSLVRGTTPTTHALLTGVGAAVAMRTRQKERRVVGRLGRRRWKHPS